MFNLIRTSIVMLGLLTLMLGGIYPWIATAAVQAFFPDQAEGSLVTAKDGKVAGSGLIGQSFTGDRYFWGRPSATSPMPYNAASSSGSNLGSANPVLLDAIKVRLEVLRQADPVNRLKVPVDLVTASASGIDPEISPAAAEYQVARVARARKMPVAEVREQVARFTYDRTLGILGEARVNVLKLNLALDGRI